MLLCLSHNVSWLILALPTIDEGILLLSDCQIVAKLSSIYPKDEDAPPGGVDDMTKLSYLHEPGVLQNLAARYQLNEIYVQHLLYLLQNHQLLMINRHILLLVYGRLTPEVFLLPSIHFKGFLTFMMATWWNNTREHPLENWVLMFLLLLICLTGFISFSLFKFGYFVRYSSNIFQVVYIDIGQW